jgi:hypothetical protein
VPPSWWLLASPHRQEGSGLMLEFLLYLIAFLCFLAVAAGVSPARVNLLGVGLGAWVLVPLIKAWPG